MRKVRVAIELLGLLLGPPAVRKYFVNGLRKDRREAMLRLMDLHPPFVPGTAESNEPVYRFKFEERYCNMKLSESSFSLKQSQVPACLRGHLPKERSARRA